MLQFPQQIENLVMKTDHKITSPGTCYHFCFFLEVTECLISPCTLSFGCNTQSTSGKYLASGWGDFPLCKSLICPSTARAAGSHIPPRLLFQWRSWGMAKHIHMPESDIVFLSEKVIASAEEMKHHNETTIKRGPSLSALITNTTDVAPSPAQQQRLCQHCCRSRAPVQGLDGTTSSTRPFLPSQASQLSPNFQCLGCLFLGFISMLRKRV